MEQRNAKVQTENQREQMLKLILGAVQKLDDRKLRNIYYLVLHIQ